MGIIIGPAIKIDDTSSASTTPSSAEEELEDYDKFIEYFRDYYDDTTEIKEKNFEYVEGTKEKIEQYKVEEYKDSDDNKYRIVGHELNLDANDYIDDELEEMMEDYGENNGTQKGKWIPGDFVEMYEEVLLTETIGAIKEKAAAIGVNLTTYQIYAIALWCYDSEDGAIEAAGGNSYYNKASLFDANEYYGQKDKTLEGDLATKLRIYDPACAVFKDCLCMDILMTR